MTDEQINQWIAEACGWVQSKSPEWYQWWHKKGSRNYQIYCPNYAGCLNAMHEAERTLSDNEEYDYWYILIESCEHIQLLAGMATAAKRAEAFLKTIGKWEEEV